MGLTLFNDTKFDHSVQFSVIKMDNFKPFSAFESILKILNETLNVFQQTLNLVILFDL